MSAVRKWVIFLQTKSGSMKRVKKDYEKTGFLTLLLVMAVYYGYRLFALTPWYDELYTYYFFISRGPVYAAIHWPVPNNHVGYSVLSAILDYFGNPYIGLRGVSYLCALTNLVLLFRIGRAYLARGLSLFVVILYVSMNLVNQLAVQGRGYTLGITCYLTAFCCLIVICREEQCRKRYFILFSLSLVLALYTLTSDVYFVLPVCLTGGIYLLYLGILERKERECRLKECKPFRKLLFLILASLAAAVMTIILYSIIWIAIGSNLLVKDEASGFYGMGHVRMILSAPFKALKTGMEYMLATPYIQSVAREGFLKRLFDWFGVLFNWYYDGMGIAVSVLVIICLIVLLLTLIRSMKRKEKGSQLLSLFLLTGMLCMPLFLMIQCALPYYRVFVYGGVLLALAVGFLVQKVLEFPKEIRSKSVKVTWSTGVIASSLLISTALSVFCFTSKGYQNQYSMREYYIQDALTHGNITQAENLCVTDCTQQYLMKFLYDITCENTVIEGSDYVLFDKKMLAPEYNEMEWEFYHYYNTIPWDYVNDNLKQVYENESFVLFIKNT